MNKAGTVAVALNMLWLIVIIYFVSLQGLESYDAIGWSVLILVIVTPMVNLYVLLFSQNKKKNTDQRQ